MIGFDYTIDVMALPSGMKYLFPWKAPGTKPKRFFQRILMNVLNKGVNF